MSTVPVTRTWVAGEVVTAAYMNNSVTGPIAWLLAPALCQLRQIVAQSIPNATTTPLTFTAEDVDTTGMHSTSVNTSRATAVYPGWYWAAMAGSQANNTTGRRICAYRVNGTDVPSSFSGAEPTITSVTIAVGRTMLLFLNVGDYAEACLQQSSGVALLTVVSSNDQSNFALMWASN